MSAEIAGHATSIVSDFQAWVALWIWVPAVLLHGLWRSLFRPEPDEIRSSGPRAAVRRS